MHPECKNSNDVRGEPCPKCAQGMKRDLLGALRPRPVSARLQVARQEVGSKAFRIDLLGPSQLTHLVQLAPVRLAIVEERFLALEHPLVDRFEFCLRQSPNVNAPDGPDVSELPDDLHDALDVREIEMPRN